jgi:hypothetical protein
LQALDDLPLALLQVANLELGGLDLDLAAIRHLLVVALHGAEESVPKR